MLCKRSECKIYHSFTQPRTFAFSIYHISQVMYWAAKSPFWTFSATWFVLRLVFSCSLWFLAFVSLAFVWPAMILTSHACAYGSRSHMTRQYSCTNRVNGIVRPSWVLENTQYHWTINTHTWEWYCVCKMALYKLSIVVLSCVVSCCISLCDFVLRFVVLCCFGVFCA